MSVTLIIGPMFSGKTTELFRRLNREKIAGKQIQVFKYDKDVRYTKKQLACSHDGQTLSAIPISSFSGVSIDNNTTVIGIDEGQFIDGIIEFCDQQANNGKTIIVSGLDSNFKKEPFRKITDLIPKAEHIIKLHSICITCKNSQGAFSKKIIPDDKIEDIGGSEKYISVCRICYNK